MSILSIKHLYFSYDDGNTAVLKDINYEFEKGKMYAISGKSGVGKTTLLSLICGLDVPNDGQILFEGKDISKIDRERYRSHDIGVVFQNFNLLNHLTAMENILLSMNINGMKPSNPKAHVLRIFQAVGLDESKANRPIPKLSGGEQQRVAIARALCYDPQIILADEPTGNLDNETEQSIASLLKRLASEQRKCVIVATHSTHIAQSADILYSLDPPQDRQVNDNATPLH
ncbi:ABC transporter ATP-binding protein [Candidatus Soleaferrea massiliensis]|uniref:ABC transporter ATP-binding protein n=1 Tax=Candidatus Soleaferrea massiliensis TaxID=1470354 RepID=UPI0006940B7B|nr:ABC transporter ATP-binding protein [Candidatus Soleaferrea massiliensis]